MVKSAVAVQPLVAPFWAVSTQTDPELDVLVLMTCLDREVALKGLPLARVGPSPPVLSETSNELGKVLEAAGVVVHDLARRGEPVNTKLSHRDLRWAGHGLLFNQREVLIL